MQPSSLSAPSALARAAAVVAVTTSLLAPTCAAQGQGVQARQTTVRPHRIAPDVSPPVPPAPDSLRNWEAKPPAPPLPAGPPSTRPRPNTPPLQVVGPHGSPFDTGQLVYFQNDLIQQPPSSVASRSSPRTPEPSCGILRDTVLQTGNWQAAFSPDNGETWDIVAPGSFIPPADGGFCCDQQVIHVPAHDLVIWVLQYLTDSRGNNRLRFAVANGRDRLRSLRPSDWYYYDIIASSMLGYISGQWLNYPDIAEDGTYLYATAEVVNAGESAIWRMDLAQMAAGATTRVDYARSKWLGGRHYRLAKGVGGNLMAFGCHLSSTQVRVFTWPVGSPNIASSDHTVAPWVNTTGVAACPDGRPFAGGAVSNIIRGAFGNSTEFGLLWSCAQTTGRPYPYTRVARFRVSDRGLIAEHDMWSTVEAYVYADATSNSLDHIGGVIALGGPSRYVTCANWIVDPYDPWPVSTVYVQANGTAGPDQDRFGDFFTVRRHPLSPRTFISNGATCYDDGGLTRGAHRHVWFGRDDYEPAWVTLDVRSSPVTGVPITQAETDLDSRKDGATGYSRRFAPEQGYELTAALRHRVGATDYAFHRWAHRDSPGSGFTLHPIGVPTLLVDSIGVTNDTAEARYLPRRTLTVQSTDPPSGVPIKVSVADLTGSQGGITTFTRHYYDGEVVALTAPSAAGFNPFRRWVVDGTPIAGNPISLAMTAARTAIAEYRRNIPGKVNPLGLGCPGSSGVVPVQAISWPGGQQGPQQGTPTTYGLAKARASTVSVLHFGIGTVQWGPFPLPLKLDFLGMKNCVLYHDIVVSPPVAVGATGSGSLSVVYPVDPAAVGGSIYTTFGVLDSGANALGVVHSNAMETVQGGNR